MLHSHRPPPAESPWSPHCAKYLADSRGLSHRGSFPRVAAPTCRCKCARPSTQHTNPRHHSLKLQTILKTRFRSLPCHAQIASKKPRTMCQSSHEIQGRNHGDLRWKSAGGADRAVTRECAQQLSLYLEKRASRRE
uniref:Uncharacterized protein n=1 Tax=Oryza brachyantha TaxID=4533 RepID=J3MUE3_ORYBR